MSDFGGQPPELPEPSDPFTESSWIESSRWRLRYRHVALGLWAIFILGFLIYGLSERFSLISQAIREVGFAAAISRIWSPEALTLLGLEALVSLFALGGLLALAWWKKPPEAPEAPTFITWVIAWLGVLVILVSEILGIVTTAGWTAPIWLFVSLVSLVYFILWLFQPWFEYWRHLYCRWVFTASKVCRRWTKQARLECRQWYVQEYLSCVQYYAVEYQKCVQWETTQEFRCTLWKQVTTSQCASWHWALKWICLGWSYVTTWVCDLFTLVVSSVCKLWSLVRELVCKLWVLSRTAICLLQWWIISRICTLIFFILKLVLMCWCR